MKTLVIALAALCAAHQALAAPGMMAKCMHDNNVTPADAIKFAMTGEASDNLKCNFKCVMLASGTMTEDGKLILEPMIAHVPEKLHPAFKKCCEIEASTDLCDLAFRHNKCLRDSVTEWYQNMVKTNNS